MRQGPLAGRYGYVATMVMFALIPYLALSAALEPLTPIIAQQLHTSLQTLSLGSGLSNAAYAVGTVLAVQLAQHRPQRRMMVGYAVLLVIGSVLSASAPNATVYIAGRVLQGLCTSLLLIAAVPPLALGYPTSKLRTTAMIMNMCIFGAVALGPTIGGLQAQADAWRPLFWVVAAVAALALVLALLTFEDAPPADPDSPRDLLALGLATVGCVAAFFGSSQLLTHPFLDPLTIVLLVLGLATIVVLVVYQCRAKNPLLTIREMVGSTIPVAGIVVALCAAAASVSATGLTALALSERYSPLHLGLLYLPEVAGAVITAIVLGFVLARRAIHYLPLIGMGFLAAGIAVFLVQVPASPTLTLVGSFLTGIGLGATVAPALFVAGFSLRAPALQRVFAIVELFRAVAAFMIAPIFVHLAATVGGGLNEGITIALWIGLGLALGGAALGVVLYALGGARPQTPDLDGFLAGTNSAWHSPPLLARLRPSVRREEGLALAARAAGPTAASASVAAATHAPAGAPAAATAPAQAAPQHAPPAGPDGLRRGPVLFAYDGSELSARAIEQAADQLAPGREALVLCVWQPAEVGFVPAGGQHLRATDASEVREAAEQTATRGATLAQAAGFRSRSLAVEGAPSWQSIVDVAEQYAASLIVVGSHRRHGLTGHLQGSVAAATLAHASAPVLVVHQ